jgi:hypothetical protein
MISTKCFFFQNEHIYLIQEPILCLLQLLRPPPPLSTLQTLRLLLRQQPACKTRLQQTLTILNTLKVKSHFLFSPNSTFPALECPGACAGKYHCTIGLLFDWFRINCMTTDNFCFYLQNRLVKTSQTGQRYSDTSPFSIP